MSDSSASTDYDDVVTIIDRVYQRYSVDNLIYRVPNDEEEIDRLESQHAIFLRTIGRMIPRFSPGPGELRILECGAGGMHWVMDVARSVPNCQIVVFDINEPEVGDHNIEFIRHDLNRTIPPRHEDTIHDNTYDFVHSQCVGLGISANRWGRRSREHGRRVTRGYVADLYRVLRPGGRASFVEYSYRIQSDAGLLPDKSPISEWSDYMEYSMDPPASSRGERTGGNARDWLAASRLQERMDAAGFSRITATQYRLPIGSWDPQNPALDRDILDMVKSMLDSHIKLPLIQMFGAKWTEAHVQQFIVNAQEYLELSIGSAVDPRPKRLYLTLYVVEGQKR